MKMNRRLLTRGIFKSNDGTTIIIDLHYDSDKEDMFVKINEGSMAYSINNNFAAIDAEYAVISPDIREFVLTEMMGSAISELEKIKKQGELVDLLDEYANDKFAEFIDRYEADMERVSEDLLDNFQQVVDDSVNLEAMARASLLNRLRVEIKERFKYEERRRYKQMWRRR